MDDFGLGFGWTQVASAKVEVVLLRTIFSWALYVTLVELPGEIMTTSGRDRER